MNSINSSMNTSNQNSIPSGLSEYLSKAKNDSRKLISAIDSLCSQTDKDRISDAADKFVKYYNNFIKDNKIYNDAGLDELTQKINGIINDNSKTLSSLGINIKSNGNLSFDQATLDTTISKNLYTSIISSNKTSDSIFFKLNSLLTKIKKDSSFYLSYNSKQLIKNGNTSIVPSKTTTGTTQTIADSNSTENASTITDTNSNSSLDTYV